MGSVPALWLLSLFCICLPNYLGQPLEDFFHLLVRLFNSQHIVSIHEKILLSHFFSIFCSLPQDRHGEVCLPYALILCSISISMNSSCKRVGGSQPLH